MLRDPRKKRSGPLARVVGLLPRAASAARDELALLSPRKTLAEALSSLLPRQTFGRTRTAVLREAGVEIGTGTLVLGPVRMDYPVAITAVREAARELSRFVAEVYDE